MEWPKIIWLGHISKLNYFDIACYHLNINALSNQTGNVCFMMFVDGRKIVTTGKMCAFCHIDPSFLVQSPVDQSQVYYQKRPVRIAHSDSEDVCFLLDTSTVR